MMRVQRSFYNLHTRYFPRLILSFKRIISKYEGKPTLVVFYPYSLLNLSAYRILRGISCKSQPAPFALRSFL